MIDYKMPRVITSVRFDMDAHGILRNEQGEDTGLVAVQRKHLVELAERICADEDTVCQVCHASECNCPARWLSMFLPEKNAR